MASSQTTQNSFDKQATNVPATSSKAATLAPKATTSSAKVIATPTRGAMIPSKSVPALAKATATRAIQTATSAGAAPTPANGTTAPTKKTKKINPVAQTADKDNKAPTRTGNGKTILKSNSKKKKRARDDDIVAPEEVTPHAPKSSSKTPASSKSGSNPASTAKNKSDNVSVNKGKDHANVVAVERVEKNDNKSAPSPDEPSPKRTKGFKSRRGPSFQGVEASSGSLPNDGPMQFSTTCYCVHLGNDGFNFFIHEYFLSKSPRLLEEVVTAKNKLCKTQQQIIQLLPHDKGAFGQLVGFLYSDQFKTLECNKAKKRIGYRMKEIFEVMSLAKYYDMPSLQKDIMRVVSKDRLVQKVDAGAFFDWAEDMWYEEMDMKNGPFIKYLQRHAPAMLRSATEKDLKGMKKIINGGGEYVKELFVAMHKAFSLGGEPTIKLEPGIVSAQVNQTVDR